MPLSLGSAATSRFSAKVLVGFLVAVLPAAVPGRRLEEGDVSRAKAGDVWSWPWPTRRRFTWPTRRRRTTKCFKSADIDKNVPLPPPDSTPEELQGLFWMDQTGAYSFSDVPKSMPELLLSFGDAAFSKYDPQTRHIDVSCTGPSWVWQNRKEAYLYYEILRKANFYFKFQANEDLSVIQVSPSVHFPGLGHVSPDFTFASTFTMKKMTHENATCPPADGASKTERAKCAAWDRESVMFGQTFHYYVWRIVDGRGNRIQPYYDEFVKYAEGTDNYNKAVAWMTSMPKTCATPNSAMAGLRAR